MKKQTGFTLIEIIATLIIAGILTAIAGMGIVQVVRGYTTTKENARIAEQAQLAISRITKEIIELADIPTASSSTSIFIKNIDGNRSLGWYTTDNTLRVNATGGPISSGDILVEGVNSFALKYYYGGANPPAYTSTWTGSIDISQLKFIEVNLSLNRQDGGYIEFTTLVAPRNNKNTGGTAPPSAPPSAPNYGCFIATAAYGSAFHPAVFVLRDFRDRFLSSWKVGRFLVDFYYSYSPFLAEMIRESTTAMFIARIMLFPVTILALFILYAPLALVVLPITLVLFRKLGLAKLEPRSRICHASKRARQVDDSNGTVLLSLLFTIVIMGVLSAAILPIFSSSKFSQVYADQGAKAYFLAESGFRYAASVYRNVGDDSARFDALRNDLNRKTCTLLNNDGSFCLIVYPYWYRTSSVSGTTLAVQLPGEFDPTASLPTAGYLRIGNNYYSYSGSSGGTGGGKCGQTAGSSSLTFTGVTPNPPTGTDYVYIVALPSTTQTVTLKGSLTVSSTGASILPQINGTFTLSPPPPGTLSNTAYTYENRTGTTLSAIDLVDKTKTWTNLTITSGAITNANTTKITLTKYLRLLSTGTYGVTSPVSKEILYNVPIGWSAGPFQKEQYQDTFDSLANWVAPTGGGDFGGTHSIQSIDGSNAMKVDSAPYPSTGAWWTGAGQWAAIFFNWGNTNANLAQSWLDNNGSLSYDLQVKVRNNQPYYFAGLNFRMRNNSDNTDLYSYGVSFMKPRLQQICFLGACGDWNAPNDLATDLIPGYVSGTSPGPLLSPSTNMETGTSGNFILRYNYRYGFPVILLWERTSTGFKWLAYRTLTAADGIVTYSSSTKAYRLVNWSTLMVRLIEGYTLPFSNGGGTTGTGVPIKSGDTISTSNGSKSARVIGTPILTGGSWTARNAQGTFTLSCNPDRGNFVSGDLLFVNGVQLAQATGSLGTPKQNYFRVYYTGPTALGTANAIQTDNNRLANPRGSVNWPPDDLADLSAINDYVTMIGGTSGLQWTGYNTGVSAITSTSEPNAIIANGDLVTPPWTSTSTTANFAFVNGNSGDSIALVTSSASATSTYYDDFGIQLFLKSGSGFLPPIQQ